MKGPNLKEGLKAFFRDKLKLDDSFISDLGDMVIKRHRDPRSKVQDEVLVLFENKEVRDAIKAASPNLAGEGRKAGVRLQVPGHLLTNFKLLENLGYQMKAVDSSVRRVVKFDDSNQDLVLDVRIGDEWKRVRPSEAQAAKMSKTFRSTNGPAEMNSSSIADFFGRASAQSS